MSKQYTDHFEEVEKEYNPNNHKSLNKKQRKQAKRFRNSRKAGAKWGKFNVEL